jgi:flagellar biosynthesis/type III secretory pathway chaperone
MSRPSPSVASTRLVDILGKSVYQALGLKESLENERQALENQDIDALHAAVEIKSSCVAQLQELENERRDICAACGFDDRDGQMQQIAAWCDHDSKIEDCWEQLMVIAAECSAHNITNGSIIRLHQQHIESSLSILRGETPGRDTYNRNGTGSGGPSHRSLAEA